MPVEYPIFKERGLVALWVLALLLMFFLSTCSKTDPDSIPSSVEVTQLESYNSILPAEEGKLANPNILEYDGDSHLFVYDSGNRKVFELDEDGNIVNNFGRQGRGPGEFLRVNNIFLVNDYLYVVDQVQFRISRFHLNGDLDAMMNYGKGNPQIMPPAAPLSLEPRAKDINNKPFITLKGNVLLSAAGPENNMNTLYSLVKWKGDNISKMGEIPEGSAFILDFNTYQHAIEEKKVPPYYRPYVFPINDYTNTEELYFVYSALPKIAKYRVSGEKKWEADIPQTPELDSLTTYFYDVSEKMRDQDRITLRQYVSGVSNDSGSVYLALGKYRNFPNSLWIHKFNSDGRLVDRYQLMSEEQDLVPIFDIDFTNRRIFVITREAGIRAYPF